MVTTFHVKCTPCKVYTVKPEVETVAYYGQVYPFIFYVVITSYKDSIVPITKVQSTECNNFMTPCMK